MARRFKHGDPALSLVPSSRMSATGKGNNPATRPRLQPAQRDRRLPRLPVFLYASHQCAPMDLAYPISVALQPELASLPKNTNPPRQPPNNPISDNRSAQMSISSNHYP